MRDEHDTKDTLRVTIPIFYKSVPYVYVKADTLSNSYRLSANYKYLNVHYNLKMNFIRDLNKIENWNNKYFSIATKDNVNEITLSDATLWQEWVIGTQSQGLSAFRIISDNLDTSLIVLKRTFDNDTDYSVFFASTKYHTLEQFIGA